MTAVDLVCLKGSEKVNSNNAGEKEKGKKIFIQNAMPLLTKDLKSDNAALSLLDLEYLI